MKKLKNHRGKLISGYIAALILFCATAFAQVGGTTALTSSMDIGSSGSEVSSLQAFLAKDSSIYPQGLVTGYYGTLTAAAVRNFQTRYGISAVGRVGPQTRAKINELMASGGLGSGTGSSQVGGVAPYIYNISSSTMSNSDNTKSIVLSWTTNKPSRGKIFYSQSPLTMTETSSPTMEPGISGSVVTSDTFDTSKSLSISNYPASTTLYYVIEAIDQGGNVSVTWPTQVMTQ